MGNMWKSVDMKNASTFVQHFHSSVSELPG